MMTDQLKDTEVVLVHGGWSDGSCWSKVLFELQQRNIRASAAQLSLSSFEADVLALQHHIESRAAQYLVLVGHSYGGAVITETAPQYDAVQALVYVAASAPVIGQTFGEFMQAHPSPSEVALVPDGHGLLWAQRAAFTNALSQDLSESESDLLHAVQKPVAAAILGASVSYEGWRVKPCWYVVAEDDRLFASADQHDLAKQIQATVASLKSGHFVPLRRPTELVDIIVGALNRQDVRKG